MRALLSEGASRGASAAPFPEAAAYRFVAESAVRTLCLSEGDEMCDNSGAAT